MKPFQARTKPFLQWLVPSLFCLYLVAPAALSADSTLLPDVAVPPDTRQDATSVDGPSEDETSPGPAVSTADGVTLELIMSDPDWLGSAPQDPYWSDDSQHLYFHRKRQGYEEQDLYRLARDGDTPRIVDDAELGQVDVEDGDWSADRRFKTYAHRGDIFFKDVTGGEVQQLTRSVDTEHHPRFMDGDRRILFQRGHNVFVRHLDNGLESQLVDLRLEKDPAEETASSYLERQQRKLLDIIRQRDEDEARQRQRSTEQRQMDASLPPEPWYLGDEIEIISSTASPSGDWMALVVREVQRDDGRKDQMPNYVTASGYVESRDVRPKVGTADGGGEQLWILDLTAGQRHEIDFALLPGISEDPLADLRKRAAADASAREAAEQTKERGAGDASADTTKTDDAPEDDAPKTRPVLLEEPLHWSPDGQRLLLQAHSYDNKDRWIAVVARHDFKLQPIHRLQQEGWINWSFNEYGWLPDSRSFYFLSEESGFSQLYWHDLRQGTTQRLTNSESVVADPLPTVDGSSLYFTANTLHPGRYEVYRVAVGSPAGAVEQVSDLGGRNSFALSPDGEQLAILHSTTTRPPELFVQAASPGAESRQVTHTVSEAFTSLEWVAPDIVAVPSSHQDKPIYSRYYAPSSERGHGAEGQPAVVFVHGAGYLQNAHQGWSGYFREFMFHTLLSQHGYAVLDMDYRASAGYGAEWRQAIYRQMGGPELEDLQDGVDWLVQEHGVDRSRIGVYGGSYGGFLTMMALFKEPDLFACGAALRPVTDWAHYNHPYTSNILNTPDVDPWAYERSSPIELADGLSRPLLICAPMQDDNVFFQDTVRLAQRLIELEKEDWEVAIFPVEPHGFRQPSSWLNEYRRIFKLFEQHLQPPNCEKAMQ